MCIRDSPLCDAESQYPRLHDRNASGPGNQQTARRPDGPGTGRGICPRRCTCLLYTSDAADERSSVDLGGRRIIKKKKIEKVKAITAI